jgi:hypothetical protein
MAAIDKIYGSPQQWEELHSFLLENNPDFIERMYPKPRSGVGPISNFDTWQDEWLFKNCPLDWVEERLCEQHSSKIPQWKSEK